MKTIAICDDCIDCNNFSYMAKKRNTFLLAKPYMQSIIYLHIILVNEIFLLIAAYFYYVNYLKTSAQKKEKIRKAIERQFRSYEALSKKENVIQRIRHDLKNHLQIIREMKGTKRESFLERYQEQLREISEGITHENEPEMHGEDKKEKMVQSAARGSFIVFAVDLLMVAAV